jgi:CRISPR/Cas system Type II protein with McrA/HNH and RuvC-like nuclease domain
MKSPWAKLKGNTTLNLVINTRIMSKERKWETLRAVDYSTPEKLTAWLECSEAIIAENFNAITDLLTKKSTCLNQAKQLQLDLATAEIDKQEVINNQITHFTNKAEEEEKDIAKHLDENDFLHTELEKIQNQVFLIERKTLAESSNNQTELAIITQLETIINEKAQLITNSIEKIEKQSNSQEAIRRESVLVKRRSTLTVLKNLEGTSEDTIEPPLPSTDSLLD